MSLKFSSSQGGVYKLIGAIDGDAGLELNRMARGIKGAARLNLGAVESMNSTGVRTWMSFLKSLPADCALVIEDAPPPFVDSMNMVHGLCGAAAVASIQVPYLCKSCKLEALVTTPVHPQMATNRASAPPCKRCQTAMAINVGPDYFEFTAHVRLA